MADKKSNNLLKLLQKIKESIKMISKDYCLEIERITAKKNKELDDLKNYNNLNMAQIHLNYKKYLNKQENSFANKEENFFEFLKKATQSYNNTKIELS